MKPIFDPDPNPEVQAEMVLIVMVAVLRVLKLKKMNRIFPRHLHLPLVPTP